MILDIGGRQIEVDESFRQLSPEQQSATVEEIASNLKIAPRSTAEDVALSGATSIPSGAAGVVGMPGDLQGLTGVAARKSAELAGAPVPPGVDLRKAAGATMGVLGDKLLGVPNAGKSLSGAPTSLPDMPTSSDVKGWLGALTDVLSSTSQKVGGPAFGDTTKQVMSGRYQPETVPGAIVKAGGEAAVGGAIGAPTKAMAVGNAGVGMLAEGLGQATDALLPNDGAGQGVRIMTNLLGGSVQALLTAKRGPYGRIVQEALGPDLTDAEIQRAIQLQADYHAQGRPITAGEALMEATNGRVGKIMSVEQYLEGSPGRGGATMSKFLNERSLATDREYAQQLQDIRGPQMGPQDPTIAASQFVGASKDAVDKPRQEALKQADNLYERTKYSPIPKRDLLKLEPLLATRDTVIAGQKYRSFEGSAQVQKIMDEVDNNLVGAKLDPKRVNINQIGYWHKVRERLDDHIKAAKNNPDIGANTDIDSLQNVRTMIDNVLKKNKTFAQADKIMKTEGFDPKGRLLARPVGQNAQITGESADDITRAVGANLVPKTPPATGMAGQVGEAVGEVAARNRPAAMNMVGDIIDKEFRAIPEVANAQHFKGPRFARAIANDKERYARYGSMIEESAGPQAREGFEKLIDWYKIQGFRRPLGSETEFRRMMTQDIEKGELFSPGRSVRDAANLYGKAMDAYNYTTRTGELARIFTSPTGVADLTKIARLDPRSGYFAYAVMMMMQRSLGNEPPPEGR